MKDFLTTACLSNTDFVSLLDLSASLKADPYKYGDELNNKTVALYFNKPSTRTRISFETAVARLGGFSITLSTSEMQLGRGESIEDTAKTVSRYCDAFVVRTFSDNDINTFAKAADIPVINALTDNHHPCQSLADILTIQERFGEVTGKKVAYIGDGNNVAHSLLEACALAGINVFIATPKGYEPKSDIVTNASSIAKENGSNIIILNDPNSAVDNADVVYTDVWTSMGNSEEQHTEREKAFAGFQVNSNLMKKANKNAIFMHCLPCHRGLEVTPEVIDGPQSVVFEQAENRLHTSIAVIHALINKQLQGRR